MISPKRFASHVSYCSLSSQISPQKNSEFTKEAHLPLCNQRQEEDLFSTFAISILLKNQAKMEGDRNPGKTGVTGLAVTNGESSHQSFPQGQGKICQIRFPEKNLTNSSHDIYQPLAHSNASIPSHTSASQ